jgi:hypothetical protein
MYGFTRIFKNIFTPRGCEHFFWGDPNALVWRVGASYYPPPSPCEKLERIHSKICHFMLMI